MKLTCCDSGDVCLGAVAVAVNQHVKLVRSAGCQWRHRMWRVARCVPRTPSQPSCCWIQLSLIQLEAVDVLRAVNGPRQTDACLCNVGHSQHCRYLWIYKWNTTTCKRSAYGVATISTQRIYIFLTSLLRTILIPNTVGCMRSTASSHHVCHHDDEAVNDTVKI